MKRIVRGALALGLLLAASCDLAKTNGDAGADAEAGVTASCGLALYPSDYPSTCQGSVDGVCCNEERACARNDCAVLVACRDACPAPRAATCVQDCDTRYASANGFSELFALDNCLASAPAGCAWPTK